MAPFSSDPARQSLLARLALRVRCGITERLALPDVDGREIEDHIRPLEARTIPNATPRRSAP